MRRPMPAERWSGLAALRDRPGVRRARAALRLHGKLLLALVLGAGILSMVVHWA